MPLNVSVTHQVQGCQPVFTKTATLSYKKVEYTRRILHYILSELSMKYNSKSTKAFFFSHDTFVSHWLHKSSIFKVTSKIFETFFYWDSFLHITMYLMHLTSMLSFIRFLNIVFVKVVVWENMFQLHFKLAVLNNILHILKSAFSCSIFVLSHININFAAVMYRDMLQKWTESHILDYNSAPVVCLSTQLLLTLKIPKHLLNVLLTLWNHPSNSCHNECLGTRALKRQLSILPHEATTLVELFCL